MSEMQAFRAQGNTSMVTLSTTAASTAIQLTTAGEQTVRIAIIGTAGSSAIVYLALGSSAASAAVPTSGTPGTGFAMVVPSAETFTVRPNPYLSAVTTAGTVLVFATPGDGM